MNISLSFILQILSFVERIWRIILVTLFSSMIKISFGLLQKHLENCDEFQEK